VIVCAVITYYVCWAEANYNFGVDFEFSSIVASVVVASFMSLVNLGFNSFAVLLTSFEKHRTWSGFRSHNTFKYYMFKLLLAVAMYICRFLILRNSCVFGAVGDQFLSLIIVDLTLGNVLDMMSVHVRWKYGEMKANKSQKSNEEEKPEFDVAEQYLQLLYRQFVIFLGMPIFPWLPLLGLICHVVDYKVSKYILVKYCQQKYYLHGSMKKFLTFYLFFTALIAVASYPFGAAWLFSSYSLDHCAMV